MGKSISYIERQKIISAHEQGESLTKIAVRTGRNYEGICNIWRRYTKEGESGLLPRYKNCGRKPKISFDAQTLAYVEERKSANENLGAPYLRSVTLAKFPEAKVPHERSIQRWWRKSGLTVPKSSQPKQDHTWTRKVHHTRQIDAEEQTMIGNGEKVCRLSVADEGSSAYLDAPVFAVERISQVTPEALKKI